MSINEIPSKNLALGRSDVSTLAEAVKTLYMLDEGKEPASLPDSPSELLKRLAALANRLLTSQQELHKFAFALSEGKLDAQAPDHLNFVSEFLKNLQGHLMEITWQAQQVAKGDYSQRIDFMGDFADAFNTMVENLAARETQLRENITEVTRANEQIAASKQMLTRVLGGLTDLVLAFGEKQILYANPAAQSAMGLEGDEEIAFPVQRTELLAQMIEAAEHPVRPERMEIFDSDSNRWYHINFIAMDWDGESAVLLVASDVTHVKHKEIELEFIANMDVLTGVMNRRGGLAAFRHMLTDVENFPICVCFIDLDSLKNVNDTYGHDVGDEYIINTVKSLTGGLRERDIVCRMGGDEFMLAFARTSSESAERVIRRIQDDLRERESSLKTPYNMQFSYGLSVAETPGSRTAADLVSMADNAMYQNKQAKKDALGLKEQR